MYFAVGASTYNLSSKVIPIEVRRQGLGQENPCPGDAIELTCIRSESSPAAVRWIANGTTLYTFGIPSDIGTQLANQSSRVGLIGVIINETTLTLLADLKNAPFVNNTRLTCGEIGGNSSPPIILSIFGKLLSCSLHVIIVILYGTMCHSQVQPQLLQH